MDWHVVVELLWNCRCNCSWQATSSTSAATVVVVQLLLSLFLVVQCLQSSSFFEAALWMLLVAIRLVRTGLVMGLCLDFLLICLAPSVVDLLGHALVSAALCGRSNTDSAGLIGSILAFGFQLLPVFFCSCQASWRFARQRGRECMYHTSPTASSSN